MFLNFFAPVAVQIAASIIKSKVTDEIVHDFINQHGQHGEEITPEKTAEEEFKFKIVRYLDEHIDIPFVSDDHEPALIAMVVDGFISMILLKLKPF